MNTFLDTWNKQIDPETDETYFEKRFPDGLNVIVSVTTHTLKKAKKSLTGFWGDKFQIFKHEVNMVESHQLSERLRRL